MKKIIFSLLLLTLLVTACQATPLDEYKAPPSVDTGVDPEAWATIPAGPFPYGQQSEMETIDYDYEMMVTPVTVEQYVAFLNEVIASGAASIGEVEISADQGDISWIVAGVKGYYPGEPFDGYKHEEKVLPGDQIYIPFPNDTLRLTRDGETFAAIPGWDNHPMTMVTWFGANAYCEHYGYRLPLDAEWEKAFRGTELNEKGDGLPFPWGYEITGNSANYYASFDPFETLYGKLGSTTPVGFYNGKTYNIAGHGDYKTINAASPYGLYDMAGNVWQWVGDDHHNQHYRILRGGSFYTYEIDLRNWKENGVAPYHFEPDTGFRCAR
jgi:formylglycine-generating enzyme required for sulfatase activity